MLQRDVLELDAEILGDDGAARYGGNVLEHGLATIAEARSLDGGDLQAAAQLVDDKCRKSLTLDVLCDDENGLPACTAASSSGSRVWRPPSFFSWIKM